MNISPFVASGTINEVAPLLPPDHRPLPSPLDDVKRMLPRAALTLLTLSPTTVPNPNMDATVGTIQAGEQADDPPSEDYSRLASYLRDRGAASTSSDLNVALTEHVKVVDLT